MSVYECDVDTYVRTAVGSGDLMRVMRARRAALSEDDSFTINLYASAKDDTIEGVMCIVDVPEHPDVNYIVDFFIAPTASPDARGELLAVAMKKPTVVASVITVPSLVVYEEFHQVGSVFLYSDNPLTKEEVLRIRQTYKRKVLNL